MRALSTPSPRRGDFAPASQPTTTTFSLGRWSHYEIDLELAPSATLTVIVDGTTEIDRLPLDQHWPSGRYQFTIGPDWTNDSVDAWTLNYDNVVVNAL